MDTETAASETPANMGNSRATVTVTFPAKFLKVSRRRAIETPLVAPGHDASRKVVWRSVGRLTTLTDSHFAPNWKSLSMADFITYTGGGRLQGGLDPDRTTVPIPKEIYSAASATPRLIN